jgi:5-formyltetrahydrofolate cyclo-ligase
MNEKQALRKRIIAQLNTLSHEEVHAKSVQIADHLKHTTPWKHAECILCFISMPGEIETDAIIENALEEGKTVGVPRMRGDVMDFLTITTLDEPWEMHSFGIKEPPARYPIIDPDRLPKGSILAATPGLAFDRDGGRLGRGGGFYDKYLSNYEEHIIALGICFSIQVVEQVPVEHHDCLIAGVVTENGFLPSACCPPELLDT